MKFVVNFCIADEIRMALLFDMADNSWIVVSWITSDVFRNHEENLFEILCKSERKKVPK